MATNRLSRSTSSPTVDFYLQADELSNDPVANTHVVRCYLTAINRGNTSTYYAGTTASVTASVNGTGFGVSGNDAKLASGTANGAAFWTYGPYDITVAGNADGTATASLGLTVTYPSVSGGGSTSGSFALATLTATPGVPDTVALVRNSDTQAGLSWADTSATNGQPVSNQIRTSVNGAGFSQVASISAATSLVLAVAVNQKVLAQVRATNSAGSSAWSASSNAIYTTPAAPSGVTATKDAALDITVAWAPNVGFTEHQHVVEHGTVTGGVTTWDGSPLATVAAGTSSYKHVAPNPAQVHVYRVSAKNTDTGALQSAKVLSNQVQLLAAPNKPTLPTLPTYADKGKHLVIPWTHNPVDTTPQTYYELEYSTNGGTSWTSTSKTFSTTNSYTVVASTYAADVDLTVRVRTWGQATTGGADGTGASDWSDSQTVTFKTRPVVTISAPVDAGTWTEAELAVALGFSQAEGATFVQATIVLNDGTDDLETKVSTTLASTLMDTQVEDGGTYTVTVTVLDSNGIVSDSTTSTFSVAYTLPVAAGVTVTYLDDSGIAQLDLTIPAAVAGLAVKAEAVTIYRTIDGVRETIITAYPAASALTILDMIPTIHGTNTYRVRTISADGATADTVQDLVTAEGSRAFLSTGAGYSTIISFQSNLHVASVPAREQALVQAAGRVSPIALFGVAETLEVSGSATIFPDDPSSAQEIEAFIRTAGIVCYRDPTGRRMFGTLTGSLDTPSTLQQEFQYRVVEAS